MSLYRSIFGNVVNMGFTKRSVIVLGGLAVLLSLGSLAMAGANGYTEDFEADAGGWGGDGASHQTSGGNPGGYHQASRLTYSPYHQPVDGRAVECLTGDFVERYGEKFRISLDIKLISGGNFGFIAYLYGKDATGQQTFWSRTILAPGRVPAEWKRISFEIDALNEAGWTRGGGTMSFYDTLRNISILALFGGAGKCGATTVTGTDNVEITSLASAQANAPETFASWAVDRRYRVLLDIQAPDKPFPDHMPFRKRIHFGKLLEDAGIKELFVPGSVVVTHYDEATGNETVVPHLMSESFHAGSLGDVSWDITKGNQTRYAIYFDTQQYDTPKQTRIPLIGHGDNFRYNRPGGLGPIHTHGMRPATGDVDGDGLVDVISPSIYTSTWGQPQFTFWYWKNVGTNEKPVFADFLRLHDVNGNIIPNNYNHCDLYDWNNDGRLDLVTSNAVYFNTGQASPDGMPGFKKGASIPSQGRRRFIGLRDHDGDGVNDAFYFTWGVHYIYEGNPRRNFIFTSLDMVRNSAGAGQTPQLTSVTTLERGGETNTEYYAVSDLYDFDGDGDVDCIGELMPLNKVPSIPRLVYWPNTAGPGQPPVYGKAKVIPNSNIYGCSPSVAVENDAFKGLFVMEGHRVRYFERTNQSEPGQMPNHKDKGILQQLNGRCGVDGYSSIDVEDWEGDGDWDFVAGDELGHVWLIKNAGNNDKPVFDAPVILQADGKPMRVMRWHYIADGNPEYYLGQSKPRYVDWDGDGDNDLIVANNTNRLVLFRNMGTRQSPEFGKAEMIRTRSDSTPFVYRNQPAAVDWNGDGKMDLVTRDKGGRLCLFLGTGKDESRQVKNGKPLLYENGGAIWNHHKARAVGQWDACDWDGDGDYDIIGQTGKWDASGPSLFENVGSNDKPKFRKPKRLSSFGTAISLSAHEHSFAVVDWYNQGKYDLVCGGEIGWFYFFRRPALEAKTLPAVGMSPKLEVKPGTDGSFPTID